MITINLQEKKRSLTILAIAGLISLALSCFFALPRIIKFEVEFKQNLAYIVSDLDIDNAIAGFENAAKFMDENNLSQDNCYFVYSPLCDGEKYRDKLLQAKADLEQAKNLPISKRAEILKTIRTAFVTTTEQGADKVITPDNADDIYIFRSRNGFLNLFLALWIIFGNLFSLVVIVLAIWAWLGSDKKIPIPSFNLRSSFFQSWHNR